MSTVGFVAIAFIAGIVLIIVVLAVISSLWVAWDARKRTIALLEYLKTSEQARLTDLEELRKILDGGRNVFQSVRSDMKGILDNNQSATQATLKLFEDGFRASLKNMNGKAILEAAKIIPQAVKHLEMVARSLSELITAAGESQGTPKEWMEVTRADEHAPQSESRISRSIYADQVDEGETEEEFNRVAGDLF
jgi:uncharacterized protein YoxC